MGILPAVNNSLTAIASTHIELGLVILWGIPKPCAFRSANIRDLQTRLSFITVGCRCRMLEMIWDIRLTTPASTATLVGKTTQVGIKIVAAIQSLAAGDGI